MGQPTNKGGLNPKLRFFYIFLPTDLIIILWSENTKLQIDTNIKPSSFPLNCKYTIVNSSNRTTETEN